MKLQRYIELYGHMSSFRQCLSHRVVSLNMEVFLCSYDGYSKCVSRFLIILAKLSKNGSSTYAKSIDSDSTCACANYHPDLCSLFIHSAVSNDWVSGQ